MASMALAFDILARDKGASRTFDKVGNSADSAGRKGRGFGNAIKVGLGVAAGALAALGLGEVIGKVTQALGESIAEGREAQKVGRTTAQIIKATGGAAKITADQVGDLSQRISEKAGVDDEAIQTGANLLLTFKNVRNELGKGNAVFDRATQAAVDLSSAGFGSIDSASKMLGKALQDPVKGITALSRAGVTFSDQQKEQIKTLVKSGNTLKAQKVILGEVESQVGGVAAASASMGDKVSVAVSNIKERVGTALLPILDRLGAWFLEKGLPALQRFGGWLTGNLWPALQQGYRTIMPGVTKALDILTGGVGDGEFSWRKLGDIITGKVIPFIAKLTNVYLPAWARQIRIIIEVVKGVWKVLETLLSVQRRVASALISGFVSVTRFGARMLEALSRVPGFGWAADAAAKLRRAANEGEAVKRAINGIPRQKTVDLWVRTRQTGRITMPNGTTVNVGMRAKGGPVRAGQPYAVGDNPDGSWNKTTELFWPNTAGRILNQKQIASKLGSAPAAASGTGGGVSETVVQFIVPGIGVLAEGVLQHTGRILSGGVTTVGQQ